MELVKKAGGPLWRQVSQALADEIARGVFAPGQQLPAEPALVERFGVSRDTVRRAMSRLEQRGLIRVEQGRGTYVHEAAITYALSKRTRFSENLLQQGREPRSSILSGAEEPASEEVAKALRLAPGATVAVFRSVGYADDIAINVGQSFFPSALFPGLLDYRRRHGASTTALYAAYGITDYLRLKTWINTRLPTEEEARHLRQPRSLPVLVTHKIDVEADGAPIGYSNVCWAGEQVTFVIDNSTD